MASEPEQHQPGLEDVPRTSHLYNPLPTHEPHLRLLELSLGDSDSQVECTLSVHKLSEAPDYSAISYVWGDPQPTVTIKINGLPAEIGSNCHYALWQIRSLSLARFYWIDALCINQKDLDEKAVQVCFMGRIFETAQQVFACVGPHTEDSLTFMDTVHLWPETIDDNLLDWYRPRGSSDEFGIRSAQHRKIINSVFSQNGEIDLKDFCIAATNFCRRAYWSRLWIVQEFAVARDICIVCGLDTIHWKPFSAVVLSCDTLVNTDHASLDRPGEREYHLKQQIKSILLESIENVDSIVITRLGSEKLDTGLWRLLPRFRSMQCANPLDRVYGLLHLIKHAYPSEKRIVPDYKQSPLSLALQSLSLLYLDRLNIGPGDLPDSSFFSSVGALLQALELDRQQSEAWILIQKRQQHFLDLCAQESAPVGIQFKYGAQDALREASESREPVDGYFAVSARSYHSTILEKSAGGETIIDDQVLDLERSFMEVLRSIALSYIEQQAAKTHAPPSLTPKLVRGSSNSTILVCSRAEPGDYCVRFRKFLGRSPKRYDICPCLVLRRCGSSRLFEIIGQGFLFGSPELGLNSAREMTLYFNGEDLLALSALELREETNAGVREASHDESEDSSRALHVDRLFTSLTSRAFSSFAFETAISDAG